jgi:hypothetical protein
MTTDEKLSAILAAVQTDPGNRGLARDPRDNLFTACPGDFAAACRSLANCDSIFAAIVTGFPIPLQPRPTPETDGPLGAIFLARAFLDSRLNPYGNALIFGDSTDGRGLKAGLRAAQLAVEFKSEPHGQQSRIESVSEWCIEFQVCFPQIYPSYSHLISIERPGPNASGSCHTMRGRDITELTEPAHLAFTPPRRSLVAETTIGIGDGGNEIGMGKIPHETIVKNIPNGDLIHCRVPTDHLIVAGVSNWGAYALAAGVYALRGVTPPDGLFDPDREREILEVMVREGPLVDGVTGKQTATVDGLAWEEYARPLVRIREILES